MVESVPQGSARSRAFVAGFLAQAAGAAGVMEALEAVMEPDCRVHVQNGDVLTPAASRIHTEISRAAFPDMVVEVQDVLFPDERALVQVTMSGTAAPGVPFVEPGTRFTSLGAIVGRVNERLRLSEVWSYLNPGFAFAFPPAGLAEAPPPDDGAGAAEARALYEAWVRLAAGGEDFIRAVAATVAPDGVVHLGNGDVGRVEALHGLFASVARGLPDLALSIDDAMISGGRVVVQFTMSGRHEGVLGNYPPTGRVLPSRGMLIARPSAAAQAAELWVYIAPGYAITFPPVGGGS